MAPTTEDEISQAERRRILREVTTYHAAAQGFVNDDRGGRFAVLEKAHVTGSTPVVAYPKQPSGPWSEGPGPAEPPLGYSVEAVEPVGELHERVGTSPSSYSATAAPVGVGVGVRRAALRRRV